jgi:hypothetical protein
MDALFQLIQVSHGEPTTSDPKTLPSSAWLAALLIDGWVYAVERPGRHHNVRDAWLAFTDEPCLPDSDRCAQGFWSPANGFMDRELAFELYEAEGNVGRWPPRLFSEDLWTKQPPPPPADKGR